ncbi:MAG: hypothetical protein AB1589_16625 [Cyanobacteriota bacterium]
MTRDSFIPDELAIAPKHPLGQNLELPIPHCDAASIEEIREIQRRNRILGVVKRIILLDIDTSWEYGWCVPSRILLPEDLELLTRDQPRRSALAEEQTNTTYIAVEVVYTTNLSKELW